ncbi:MAG: cytochrome c peroxidase, partial [Pseudolabrys sp.]
MIGVWPIHCSAVRRGLLCLLLCAELGSAGTDAGANTVGMTRAQVYARAAALEQLGRTLFADPSLSGSGRMACATCHD